MKIKKGSIVIFSNEAYEDYFIYGVFKFLKDSNLIEEKQKFNKNNRMGFINFLIKNKIIKEIKHNEIWLGDSGVLELEKRI